MNNKKQEKQIKFLSQQNVYHTLLIAAYAVLPLTSQEKYILLFLYLLMTTRDVMRIKKGEK